MSIQYARMDNALHAHAHSKCAGFIQDQITGDEEEEEMAEEWEAEEEEEGEGVSEPPPQPAVITTRINDKVT